MTNSDTLTAEPGIDYEFLLDTPPPSVAQPKDNRPAQKTGMELTAAATPDDRRSKYFLFSWAELDHWQNNYNQQLETAETRLRSAPDDMLAWRRKKVAEWSRATATEEHQRTKDNRWLEFPTLIEEFMHGAYGIEDFLTDPTVSEVFLDGKKEVRVMHRDGKLKTHPPIARNNEDFLTLCRNWVDMFGSNNERLDRASPAANITLPNGDRLHVIAFLGDEAGHVTIRRHDFSITNFDVIINNGTLTAQVARFLKCAVKGRLNLICAGATGAGKTTLLRCMLTEIPNAERVIIIEDTKEIGYKHTHPEKWGVELRKRHANIENEGEISMEQIINESLRMNPDRVIVGEVRGAEVTPMLLSMSQGNDGSLATIHANSASDVISRLHNFMSFYAARPLSDAAVLRMIGHAVEVIVYLQRVDGVPRLCEIIAIESAQTDVDGRPAISEIVKWDAINKKAEIRNTALPSRIRDKLVRGGWTGWDHSLSEADDLVL